MESVNYLKNKKLKSFSEQQLVDCSTSYGNHGCNGGMPYNSFKYLESHFEVEENQYSYSGKDGTCRVDGQSGDVKVKSYSHIKPSDS